MRFGSRGPSEFATEMPWPRLRGKTPYRDYVWQERQRKKGKSCLWATCFTNGDIPACCFTSVSRAQIANINPQQEATLSLWKKKNISLRERRKWSLGLGQHLKGALPNVRTSHTSREIKTATIRELTFLKSSKSREQFLLRLTLFYPV